ncbi:aminoacyl-histidine dipeptidase [Bacteroidia bacterium]|nr:aminoacyl-histidine dipeptidase [Bacteroidia bacterium]
MNDILNTLTPEKIWYYFGKVLQIPRASKKEEHIRAFVTDFAKSHKLSYDVDAVGNVLIRKPATQGYENRRVVALQCHLDMVCEKNSDTVFDFDTEPIQVEVIEGWLHAKGTTLGADNGIGVAAALAILDSPDIQHGDLECLFTTDEETGMTGAFGLQPGWLKADILLNLDSEDDGLFFMGCAGGIDTVIKLAYSKEPLPQGYTSYRLSVKGLKGGHSGDDINRGRENALKLCNRLLSQGIKDYALRLDGFNGGNLRNAIPREASATIAIPTQHQVAFETFVAHFTQTVRKELPVTEPDLTIVLEPLASLTHVLPHQTAQNLCLALSAVPHGVVRMASDIPNFVETSTNLASIKTPITQNGDILIQTSQRSSVDSRKHEIAHSVGAAFTLIGATVTHGEGYPGWTPNPQSPILKLCLDCFKKLFKQDGEALAIHAGLECGLISEKYPAMDMVSFGPTMRGVHSPDEKLEIATVTRFWELTLEILRNIPVKKIEN